MNSSLVKGVKKLSIEFVVLIFIMGFFSKTVFGFLLPEVQAVRIAQGQTITKTLRLQGRIEAKDTLRVILSEDIVIESFFISVGDKIHEGDPIFKIDTSYNNANKSDQLGNLLLKIENEEVKREKLLWNLEAEERELENLLKTIEKEKESLEGSEALYKAGAIPYADLLKIKDRIESIEESYRVAQMKYEITEMETTNSLKNIDNAIGQLRDEISKLNNKNDYFATISNDGIYYATTSGVILSTNNTNEILRRETPLLEIAIVDNYMDIKIASYIHEGDREFIELGKTVRFREETKDRNITTKISNISGVAQNNYIKVEATLEENASGEPLLGATLDGSIIKSTEGSYVVPKSAINPTQDFNDGKTGVIYVIEEEEGVLGKKYYAKELTVTLEAVGDQRVSISGIQGYTDNYVINNLSYKIRDGVRVNWK